MSINRQNSWWIKNTLKWSRWISYKIWVKFAIRTKSSWLEQQIKNKLFRSQKQSNRCCSLWNRRKNCPKTWISSFPNRSGSSSKNLMRRASYWCFLRISSSWGSTVFSLVRNNSKEMCIIWNAVKFRDYSWERIKLSKWDKTL